MHGLKEAKEKILDSRNIVISGHMNPDGDSIGSLLSLGLGLETLGKNISMISYDGVPKRYKFLPGADRIVREVNRINDLGIAVDCSNKEILGKNFNSIRNTKSIIALDHHEFRRPFENIKVIDYKAASVGEMIYILLEELQVEIDKDIAQDILTSIIVETNSFRLPNVRPATFDICAKLIKKGVDFYKLADSVFWSKSKASVILTGVCLSRCKFLKNDRIAWSIIRKSDFDKIKGKDEDVDAVADEIRAIQEVQIVVLLREKAKGKLRVSLRSKGRLNVASVAEKFGGGGHFDVAGCSISNSNESIGKLLNLIEELL